MQPDLDLRHEATAGIATLMGHDRHLFVDVHHDFGFALNDAERDEAQLAAIGLRCIASKACVPALARLASVDLLGVGLTGWPICTAVTSHKTHQAGVWNGRND